MFQSEDTIEHFPFLIYNYLFHLHTHFFTFLFLLYLLWPDTPSDLETSKYFILVVCTVFFPWFSLLLGFDYAFLIMLFYFINFVEVWLLLVHFHQIRHSPSIDEIMPEYINKLIENILYINHMKMCIPRDMGTLTHGYYVNDIPHTTFVGYLLFTMNFHKYIYHLLFLVTLKVDKLCIMLMLAMKKLKLRKDEFSQTVLPTVFKLQYFFHPLCYVAYA